MRFQCFGTECGVWADAAAAAAARRTLLDWHVRFSRFEPASELTRLNEDPYEVVPVSATMARLVAAVREAGEATGGLVDGTLLGEIEAAGYVGALGAPLPLELALRLAPPRRPAAPSPVAGWRSLSVSGRWVTRKPGVRLDSGGLAKGLFADLLAERLEPLGPYAVDCGGDLRFAGGAPRRLAAGSRPGGGSPRRRSDVEEPSGGWPPRRSDAAGSPGGGGPRRIDVADPFGGGPLHRFELRAGAVATSGIGARSWIGRDGRPAHHLLDPSTGRPAFTGVVQATALAPTALEAEWRAKAALLSGPDGAASWLAHGGLVVLDDCSHFLIEPARLAPAAIRRRGGVAARP